MSLVVKVSRNTVEDGQQQSEADDKEEVGAPASPDPDRVELVMLPVNRFGISRCVQNYFLRSKYNHVVWYLLQHCS